MTVPCHVSLVFLIKTRASAETGPRASVVRIIVLHIQSCLSFNAKSISENVHCHGSFVCRHGKTLILGMAKISARRFLLENCMNYSKKIVVYTL